MRAGPSARRVGVLVLAVCALATSACTRVEDPWVQDPEDLKAERERPAELQEALRARLRATQTDR